MYQRCDLVHPEYWTRRTNGEVK